MKTYSRQNLSSSARAFNIVQSPLNMEPLSVERPKKRKITDFFCKAIPENAPSTTKTSLADESQARVKVATKVSRQMQTFLDFGQKGLSATMCSECELVYDPSFPEDVSRHTKEHKRFNDCFKAKNYQGAARWKSVRKNGDCIIVVPGGSRIEELCNRINRLVEAVEQKLEEIEQLSFYMYIRDGRVISLLSAEEICKARRKDPNGGEYKVRDVKIGISRVWTDTRYRRKGLAMLLLESIRKCTMHQMDIQCDESCHVPPNMIAFSQPTTSGTALAQKFLNADLSYIVYT